MTITNLEEGGVCVCRNIPETDVITAELQGSVSNYMPRNFELDVLILSFRRVLYVRVVCFLSGNSPAGNYPKRKHTT